MGIVILCSIFKLFIPSQRTKYSLGDCQMFHWVRFLFVLILSFAETYFYEATVSSQVLIVLVEGSLHLSMAHLKQCATSLLSEQISVCGLILAVFSVGCVDFFYKASCQNSIWTSNYFKVKYVQYMWLPKETKGVQGFKQCCGPVNCKNVVLFSSQNTKEETYKVKKLYQSS